VPRTFTNDWLGGDLTSSRNVVQMPHGPLISDTSIAVIQSTYAGGPVWQTADLIVNPRAGTARPRNFIPFWQGPWTGTYTGGRLVPSDNITAGILEIIWDLWGTQRWVEPDTTYPDLNQLAQFEQIEGGEYRVPGRAAELLEGERYYGFG
jgi:hypothetical protein